MKLLLLGALLISSTLTFAGDVSSGGVNSPLGRSIQQIKSVLKSVDENENQYSMIHNLKQLKNDYYIVELIKDDNCVASGYQLEETEKGYSAKIDTRVLLKCEE